MLKGLKDFSLPKLEEEVLKFWRENKVFEKSLRQRKGGREFVFYEGPPTANAQPGIHHVLARVFKDIILRYKTMAGFFVPRRAGWDTHGLPVEIEIEKKLGFKNKQEIEKFGIAKFNALAKKSVWEYKKDWEDLTERIGFWLDLEHPYITYENDYIEKLWEIIKEVDKRGLLYKSRKVVPWCPRCETALSSHELAQGYEEVREEAVYMKFKIKDSPASPRASRGKQAHYVLVWTTTPWTLPGNVALAINPKHKFVKVPDPQEKGGWIILEKESARRLDSILGDPMSKKLSVNIRTSDLLKLEYDSLFKIPALQSPTSYKIYPADFVTADEGTGVVHTAVMYGEDDYQLGKEVGLPNFHTVDEHGRFTKEVPVVGGLAVKAEKTEEKIIEYLKSEGRLLKSELYSHDYPFCWRCQTPVLYYARDSWFISMSKLRKELLAANKKINWIPAHLKEGRFGEWLKEIKDWAISRERYWGTPLPIWSCDNPTSDVPKLNKKCLPLVIGSLEELKKYGGKAPKDLHRPYIDEVILKCPDCGGQMRRVREVLDVWFDSGAMPFASGEYPERYPADYIVEGIDQTRGWFYTLLAIGVLMKEGTSYKNVISLGHVLDKQGRKMSKSLGNSVDPWQMNNKYGADVVRWYFYTINPPGEPKRFDEKNLGETYRRFIGLLYNSYLFYETYSDPNDPNKHPNDPKNVLDKWILARLNETIAEAIKRLDEYDIGGAAKLIESLVDDLSRWYIRRSRKRAEALPVLGYVLLEISKLIAPFTPFFAEALFRSILGTSEVPNIDVNNRTSDVQKLKSVHLDDWPKTDKKLIDQKLLEQMAQIRQWASLALAARAEAGIKVRQPLNKLKVKSYKLKVNEELLEILADEVNVKEVIFDAEIKNEVELDTKITPELREEGILRELVRMIQDFRKEKKLKPQDKIKLRVALPEEMLGVARKNDERLRKEVGAARIEYKDSDRLTFSTH